MGAWWAMAWRWSPESACSPKLKLVPTAGLATNVDMGPTQGRDHCPVDETGRHAEGAGRGHAATNGRAMNLSARAYHRVLKLARTIADLAGSERIQPAHPAEAIHLRPAAADGVSK